MKVHELKTVAPYFYEVYTEQKKFEIRRNDRDFKVNDILHLREYEPPNFQYKEQYTGREVIAQVINILDDAEFCKIGYVVMGIKLLTKVCD